MGDPDHRTWWRIAGLAATGLLTVGAFGAGALPDPDTGSRIDDPFSLAGPYWWGLVAWFVGLALLCVVWWRLGATLRRTQQPVTLRWMLGTGAIWAAPLLFAPPVGSRDVYAYACQGALWLDGVDPYRVGVAPGGCVWTDAVSPLWRDTPTPYGPLAVALAGGAVMVARAVAGSAPDGQLLVAVGLLRVVALGGGSLIGWYAPRLARACGVDPVRAVWLGLVSPLVAVHLVAGAHNDALMVGLVLAALAVAAVGTVGGKSFGRGMGLAAVSGVGVALGLAAAIKITAVLALPFAVLLAAARISPSRVPRAVPGLAVIGGTALVAKVVVAAVVLAGAALTFGALTGLTGLDLGWVRALPDTGRLAQWTSPPTGLGMAAGYALRLAGHPEAFDSAVAAGRMIGLGALAVTAAALVGHAWRAVRPRATRAPIIERTARRGVVAACGTAFAALALLSPVFYPWYGLAAVAVLATAVTDQRWWRGLGTLVVAVSFLTLPDGLGLAVLTKLPGALLDVLLVSALLAVAARRLARQRNRAGRFAGRAGATGDSPRPRRAYAARPGRRARPRRRGSSRPWRTRRTGPPPGRGPRAGQ